jgi:hypothetical protein
MPTHDFLNDGDSDPATDNDPDNLGGRTIDDDHDFREDHVNPQNNRYHDKDDRNALAYGHEASAADKRAITATVKHYYAIAMTGDGATACSMLASSLVRAAPEDYGGARGPLYLRGGDTCQAVLSMTFKHFHAWLTEPVEVTAVRIGSGGVIAFIGSRSMPASQISLEHHQGTWKIDSLLGQAMG